MGLEGVRIEAVRDKKLRFPALLYHITPKLLTETVYAIKRDPAAGVDGVTWQEYGEGLRKRVISPRLSLRDRATLSSDNSSR
jgi:hypothetical protein